MILHQHSPSFYNPNNNQSWHDSPPAFTKFILQVMMKSQLLSYETNNYVFFYNSISPLTNKLQTTMYLHLLVSDDEVTTMGSCDRDIEIYS